jgi:ubiquinone/menaquinone biosynthesis C-methylase UbiE
MKEHVKSWEKNYQNGRANKYPFDEVVSFVLSSYLDNNKEQYRILDMGCGGGNHVKFLADEGFDYYGVDGSDISIELSKKLLGQNFTQKLEVADFTCLPYEDNFFDGLIDRQSMGHNAKHDIIKILSEIYRVLKKGGKYHGHVFGLNDDGFLHGEHIGSNDFKNFRSGHFLKAHLVHAFDHKELTEIFATFSEVNVHRKVTYDGITNKILMEIYIINAIK